MTNVTNVQVKCMACLHESNTYESFLDVCLHITQRHIADVAAAFHSFVQPEYLDGRNKYKCDKCNAYVRARRVCRS